MKIQIAILASGEGTTTEAFIHACERGEVDGEVRLVICNREDAGIFRRIEQLNQELGLTIKAVLINSHTHPLAPNERLEKGCQTLAEEYAVIAALEAANIDIVLLLGYLRRLGPEVVKQFGWRPEYISPYQARMLNTHAGLLPETEGFYGIHIQEHVLEQKLPSAGQTLHIVAENYDDGPKIAEHQVQVEPTDTPSSLFGKVQAVEKQFLPRDVNMFIMGQRQYQAEHKE